MARSVEEINRFVTAKFVSIFATAGITINPVTWSRRSILRNICWSLSECQAVFEQLQDLYQQRIESTVAKAYAGSAPWIQDKMFKFQYSAADPQVLALINLVPTYPVIRPDLRIITACSPTSTTPLEVTVKVATGNPLAALNSDQRDAAQSYLNISGIQGIAYNVVSLSGDKLYVNADVYFNGQYSTIISDNVIKALRDFLQNLSLTNFDGSMLMTDLENVIRNVTGVNDVVLKNVRGRADTDSFSAGVDLIKNTAVLFRKWVTIAGYIDEETTAGKTFADSLNFIPE